MGNCRERGCPAMSHSLLGGQHRRQAIDLPPAGFHLTAQSKKDCQASRGASAVVLFSLQVIYSGHVC